MAYQIRCSDTTNENIPSTSEKRAKRKYTLSDLHRLTFKLEGVEQACDVETCTAEQFNAFASEVADVEDVDTSAWPLEERRNLVNELWDFCRAENLDFPLTDVSEEDPEEGTPPAPLSHDSEETGFLYDVERARPVIASNPAISAKELADALGLNSAVYAQMLKVYVNAHKSEGEGAE